MQGDREEELQDVRVGNISGSTTIDDGLQRHDNTTKAENQSMDNIEYTCGLGPKVERHRTD